MANPEHVKILKQGVEVWNKWREDNGYYRYIILNPSATGFYELDLAGANLSQTDLKDADLSDANLSNADLHGAELNRAKLIGANLNAANLSKANLSYAYLIGANLSRADLSRADLFDANLTNADLSKANLSRASLYLANLSNANLSEANLSQAILGHAYLHRTILNDANLDKADLMDATIIDATLNNLNLSEASLNGTVFGNSDLSKVIGMGSIYHEAPSTIGLDTLQKSKGKIPEIFLRGCGLSDWEIENAKLYNSNLTNEEINNLQSHTQELRIKRAYQINPLFIAYSHHNSDFVDAIEPYFIDEGIRFWRDIHQAKRGRLEKPTYAALHLNDVVLLVLSEHSTNRDWVEQEARKAREKEQQTGRDAMCPIALDESWKTCSWPATLREQIMDYNILDFSNWHDDASFQKQFGKLIDRLNLFYK